MFSFLLGACSQSEVREIPSSSSSSSSSSSPFSPKIQKNIEMYEANPQYINMICGSGRSHNKVNNASVFDPLYTKLMMKEWNVSQFDYLSFMGYITSNYCPEVY